MLFAALHSHRLRVHPSIRPPARSPARLPAHPATCPAPSLPDLQAMTSARRSGRRWRATCGPRRPLGSRPPAWSTTWHSRRQRKPSLSGRRINGENSSRALCKLACAYCTGMRSVYILLFVTLLVHTCCETQQMMLVGLIGPGARTVFGLLCTLCAGYCSAVRGTHVIPQLLMVMERVLQLVTKLR